MCPWELANGAPSLVYTVYKSQKSQTLIAFTSTPDADHYVRISFNFLDRGLRFYDLSRLFLENRK